MYFFGRFDALAVNVLHDRVETVGNIFAGPGLACRVLLHFQGGDGNATGIGGLAWAVQQVGGLEDLNTLGIGRHVGTLGYGLDAVLDERAGMVAVNFVLGSARESNVDAGDVPDGTVGVELGGRAFLPRNRQHRPPANVLDFLE